MSVNEQWSELAKTIVEHGKPCYPRAIRIKELVGVQARFDLSRPVITLQDRKLHYRFGLAEALWILKGENTVGPVAKYNKRIAQFSDDGERFYGAYGPKIVDQLPYITAILKKDIETRQAVINIWRESPRESKDIPCTTTVQFLVRQGTIHTIVNMRSSDIWLGLPYDIFNFAMLTIMVAKPFDEIKQLGELIYNLGSSHAYECDWDAIQNIGPQTYCDLPILDLNFFRENDPLQWLQAQIQKDDTYGPLKQLFKLRYS